MFLCPSLAEGYQLYQDVPNFPCLRSLLTSELPYQYHSREVLFPLGLFLFFFSNFHAYFCFGFFFLFFFPFFKLINFSFFLSPSSAAYPNILLSSPPPSPSHILHYPSIHRPFLFRFTTNFFVSNSSSLCWKLLPARLFDTLPSFLFVFSVPPYSFLSCL
ncbi:hypothetical protein BO85DRAFT_255159 [Aspergillus piperis CBS 112811]|uniref:Uncharacterized protein n=1 Tax=Aspergillus piperis CBS 112811 TaxID=1448313 RepID=A0A8G1R7A8_9EURO|nr:hypothetical protein BO85DRAFT_255159 [Aspergillus piperis CBS 112811]RAH59971.1 hypothetical protein BO85DRAFT_255159 [Aspergillus piperis CBS 112811]